MQNINGKCISFETLRRHSNLEQKYRERRAQSTNCLKYALSVILFMASAASLVAQNATSCANSDPPEHNFFTQKYLFGDWGGERSALAAKGVTFDFFYVSDLQANPSGGLEQTQAGWGRIRGTVDIDFGRLAEINGLTFHATGLWQFGGNLGADIGTITNPSGLVSAHTTRLDSFWLQQAFFHNRLFVKAGQFAGLDFYGLQEYGGSYLIEPLDYALGNLFPTTFESFNPAGTPALEVRVFPLPNFYVKSAVLSGNRNPYQQDPTGTNFQIRDSPDFVFEIGYFVDPADPSSASSSGATPTKTYPGHYKFGAAYNAGKFANAQGVESSGNYLIYFGVNQAVYRPDAGSNRGLDVLTAYDWSPGELNRQNTQLTTGFRYNGLIPHRDQDGLAFAFVYSKISDPFSAAGVLLGLPALGSEKALEVNYAMQITPYLLWQPTFQYYADVGGNSHLANAPVLGFRVKVNF
jgi:porin